MADAAATDQVYTNRYRWFALIVLTLIYVMNFLDRQIMSILADDIIKEFDLTDTQMGLLTGFVFAMFYATLGMPIAMWADRSNRRNIIALALAIFSGMTALCGTATSFAQMALYRVGVGIGEAGSSPPSHSIISDLFPPEKRSSAMAIFSLGVPIGILLGFSIGGYVAENYGWRNAFYIVGIPGIVLALITRFVLKEPPRGLSDAKAGQEATAPKLADVFKLLFRRKTAFHLIMGATVTSFVGYGAVSWSAIFMIRSYGVDLTFVGFALALLFGLSGLVGNFGGGMLSDALRKRDIRWPCWVICIFTAISMPFSVAGYLSGDVYWALTFLIGPSLIGSLYLGPSLAMLHGVVPLRARALSSAIMFFILNMLGLGFGPTAVGMLSDFLAADYGQESIRYALMIFGFLQVWAIVHFYLASRHLEADTELARGE